MITRMEQIEQKGPGSSPSPSIGRANLVQALPAYAPTSIPSSTTSNSGFVHDMSHPPEKQWWSTNQWRQVQAPCQSPPDPAPA
jgi:hypothetical protein